MSEKLSFNHNQDTEEQDPTIPLTGGQPLLNDSILKGYRPIPDKYALTDTDKQNGLEKILYEARDLAANSIGALFSQLEINTELFEHLYKIPLGIDQEENIPGQYVPGVYGIVIGKESEDVQDYLNDNTNQVKSKKHLARTMAHEMIHAFQTVRLSVQDGTDYIFKTIGNTSVGIGVEEGMAEALSNIAVDMYLNNRDLKDAAQNLENFCANQDAPATQMSAKLIHKIRPEQLKNYLMLDQPGNSINELFILFGPSYQLFCQNMKKLYDYENNSKPDNLLQRITAESITNQTGRLIDNAAI